MGIAGTITVRTFAEGMLARLAHDLELRFPVLSGEVDADKRSASIMVDPHSVEILGARKGERLDESALSPSDREEIKKKLVSSLGAQSKDARIEVTITMSENRAALQVRLPCGSSRTDADVTLSDDTKRAKGSCTLSLRAMGVPEVKGPLNAFRLKDRIEVSYELEIS
jgi:hypothetical protein